MRIFDRQTPFRNVGLGLAVGSIVYLTARHLARLSRSRSFSLAMSPPLLTILLSVQAHRANPGISASPAQAAGVEPDPIQSDSSHKPDESFVERSERSEEIASYSSEDEAIFEEPNKWLPLTLEPELPEQPTYSVPPDVAAKKPEIPEQPLPPATIRDIVQLIDQLERKDRPRAKALLDRIVATERLDVLPIFQACLENQQNARITGHQNSCPVRTMDGENFEIPYREGILVGEWKVHFLRTIGCVASESDANPDAFFLCDHWATVLGRQTAIVYPKFNQPPLIWYSPVERALALSR